ncbi:MAG: molybdopterin molybdotransferase MoeA [Planctomycetaceae bacterium]|nr:molybdopterin molybdotransferase MoeA [Planctomycetaceae bacterium]
MKVEATPSASELLAQVSDFLRDRLEVIKQRREIEEVSLLSLAGRILAEDIHSSVNLPRFRRAMMDGVAVDYRRLSEGYHSLLSCEDRKTVDLLEMPLVYPVATGSSMPDKMDTVVPREHLVYVPAPAGLDPKFQYIKTPRLETVQQGQHVAQIGEDVAKGRRILSRGRVVRAQDLGLLSACGIAGAKVLQKPRVAVGLTGDEIAKPGHDLDGDQVHDANGPVLTTLLLRDGARLVATEYLADDPDAIQTFLQRNDIDILLLCGGTSVGPRDFAVEILRSIGTVAFHGLPLRPGRPVGIGSTPCASVFLLPGNPIACQFTYDLLVGPLVRGAAGRSVDWPYSRALVHLSEAVASQRGRLDYLRVVRTERRVVAGGFELGRMGPSALNGTTSRTADGPPVLVRPLTSGKASNLTSVSEADGFVLVPIDAERLLPNEPVECYWYDC